MAATAEVRRGLPPLLREFGVRTVLDAPCGDFHWMKELDLPVERYIGADVVAEIIERNRGRYAAANREFLVADLDSERSLRAAESSGSLDGKPHGRLVRYRRALRARRECLEWPAR